MNSDIRAQLQATLGSAYSLERELGGGGMSRVFVANETALRRKVVIKVLPPEMTAGVNVERFNREILLAAQLQHPHIVPVLSAGETNGLPYFTMPFVEGESLRAKLARTGALSITDAISVLRDIAKALAYAHERGIVHRDIKPDNVLMTGGSATVADFGIAKAISAARTETPGATLTQVGTSIGTPTYMAPEQAAADPSTDQRADIYSFGCVAYEVLTGRPPFVETAPRKLLAAHIGERPRPVQELRPDTPAVLAGLVMRCLEKEADDRPQQAADVVGVLEAVTSGGTQPAMPEVLFGGPTMLRKALLIYAAAFAAVAILARAAIVGIGLPAWVFPGALIVMALGLPVILFTAYVQRVARRTLTATPTFTPGGTPSLTHGTMATIAMKASPHVSWRRTARGGMWAVGVFVALVAAFMTMRAFGIGPFGSLRASGKLDKGQILLADFRATNTDSTLGRVVSEAVRQGLSESSAITLVPPTRVVAALQLMQQPPNTQIDSALAHAIAQREGIKAVLQGEVAKVGANGYIVTLKLVDAGTGAELAQFRAAGEGSQGLIDAADKTTRELRARVGESLKKVNATPALAEVTTASLDALRKYSQAFRANSFESDQARAVALTREAVAIDSSFAMAWRLMGIAMSNAGMPLAPIDSAITRAFALRNRLSTRERLWVTVNYYRNTRHLDRPRMIAAADSGLALGSATDSSVFGNYLGLALVTRQEFARAESVYVTAMKSSVASTFQFTNVAIALVEMGRFDDAEKTIGMLQQRHPQVRVAPLRIAEIRYARADIAFGRRIADSVLASKNPAQHGWAHDWLAQLALRGGRPDEWERHDAEAQHNDSLQNALRFADVDVYVRETPAHAVTRLDAALKAAPLAKMPDIERPYSAVAIAFARAGRTDKAKAVIAEFERDVTDTALRRITAPAMQTAAGELALADRRFTDALTAFRRGAMLPDGPANFCTTCLPFALARTFDAAGQPDSAVVMYEKYLATPGFSRFATAFDPSHLAMIHRRLGQLYDARQNKAKALEHYRAFVAQWGNAEPLLQPKVAEVRRRIAELERLAG